MILRTIDGREIFVADQLPMSQRCDHVGFLSYRGGDELHRLQCENCGELVERDDLPLREG